MGSKGQRRPPRGESRCSAPRRIDPWQHIEDAIEPQQTRPVLIRALRTLQTKRVEQPKRKHGNIPL